MHLKAVNWLERRDAEDAENRGEEAEKATKKYTQP
jgi:hypothetical protein